jgi:hypothetical protein
VDINPKYLEQAYVINKLFKEKFTALTDDVFNLDFDKDQVIVNTACEHFDLAKWMTRIPDGTLMVLQATDDNTYDTHINSMQMDKFKEQAGLSKILYEGDVIINWGYSKRFMLIGYK